jgi:hypothetical protein
MRSHFTKICFTKSKQKKKEKIYFMGETTVAAVLVTAATLPNKSFITNFRKFLKCIPLTLSILAIGDTRFSTTLDILLFLPRSSTFPPNRQATPPLPRWTTALAEGVW